METPPNSKQQVACIDPSINSSLASHVKGLEIYARWDGVQEHPVAVSILFTIQAQPHTQLQLFKTGDPSVVSHTVRSVVPNSATIRGVMPCGSAAELKKLQGDTLTTTEAEDYVHAIGHEACCKGDDVETLPLQTLSSSVLNRQASEAIPKGEVLSNRLATTSNGTPERQGSSSDPRTSRVLSGDENRAPDTPAISPWNSPPLLSPLPPTAEDWSIERPRRFKVRSGRPRLSGFAICEDQPHPQTPTQKHCKPVVCWSPSKQFESHTASGGRSPRLSSVPSSLSLKKSQEASMCLAARSGNEASRYYGTLPLSKPVLTRSLTMGSSESSSVTTAADLANTDDLPLKRCVDSHNTTAAPSYIMHHRELLEAVFLSPVESPRLWVNGIDCVDDTWPAVPSIVVADGDTSQFPSPSSKDRQSHHDTSPETKLLEPASMLDLAAARNPTTVVVGNELYVYFPREICPEAYSIEADLDILLSNPDCLGWQEFKIPGLPIELDTDGRGFFQFRVMSLPDDRPSMSPAQFDSRKFSIVHDVQQGHIEGDFLISESFSLRLRLQSDVRYIREWNSNVAIYSSLSHKNGQGTCMKNYANLTIEAAEEDTFASRVNFSVLVRNGPPSGGIYRLKSGQCSVELSPYEYTVTDLDRTAEIWIERDQRDMEKPLRFEFTCLYPSIQETTILMPVLFPKFGKVLSEKIWIFKPLPPLVVHPIIRSFLSTWAFSEQLVGSKELLCFLRMKMPPRYPNALSDDAVIRLRSHKPVSFAALEVPDDFEQVEECSNTIPSLNYIVDMVPRGQLECRMTFDLEVGTQQQLLRIDALEWIPKSSSINRRICSPEQPCWWEADDQLCLFKAPWMAVGDMLHIEMAFIMIGRMDDSATKSDPFMKVYGTLPRILDKVIFGGNLVCNIDDAVLTLVFNRDNVDDEDIPFSTRYRENSRRLPLLQRGHRLELTFKLRNPNWRNPTKKPESSTRADKIRFSGGIPLQPRTLRFDDEVLGTSFSSDDSDASSAVDEQLNIDREARIPGHHARSPDTTAGPAVRDEETRIDQAAEVTNGEDTSYTNDNTIEADAEVWRHWKQQLWGSDVSSSSSDESDDAPTDVDDDDDDEEEEEEDEDPGAARWLCDGTLRAVDTFLYLADVADVADVADAAFGSLQRRSPMRFVMRYLILLLVCIALRRSSPSRVDRLLLPGSNVPSSDVTGYYPTAAADSGAFSLAHHGASVLPVDLEAKGVDETGEEEGGEVVVPTGVESLRDRVDVWLGWRPVYD
ncbi:hypothetical protein XANCAGTX0491_008896 [Xanthoria calcicola]